MVEPEGVVAVAPGGGIIAAHERGELTGAGEIGGQSAQPARMEQVDSGMEHRRCKAAVEQRAQVPPGFAGRG